MKSKMKILLVGIMSVLLTNCAGNYKIKKESGNKVVDSVPKWYMADINESKACEIKMFGKDKDRVCIYGVATAVSPDLNLAIEKAKMLAKAELADIIKGEMNKESKQFITEIGKTNTKSVVTEVESVLVNVIKNTKVRGYEIFEQDVTLTKQNYYRAWIGLRLPLGEYNKMYNFTIEEAVDAYNLKEKANVAYNKLLESEKSDDKNNNIQ
jgi:hypothetical protein